MRRHRRTGPSAAPGVPAIPASFCPPRLPLRPAGLSSAASSASSAFPGRLAAAAAERCGVAWRDPAHSGQSAWPSPRGALRRAARLLFSFPATVALPSGPPAAGGGGGQPRAPLLRARRAGRFQARPGRRNSGPQRAVGLRVTWAPSGSAAPLPAPETSLPWREGVRWRGPRALNPQRPLP